MIVRAANEQAKRGYPAQCEWVWSGSGHVKDSHIVGRIGQQTVVDEAGHPVSQVDDGCGGDYPMARIGRWGRSACRETS